MIHINQITKYYQTNKSTIRVFQNFELQIEKSEFVVLMGQNGCGKTTLLHLIAGFEKPDRGTITINERFLQRPTKRLGYVLQDPTLFPWKTVLGNVLAGLEINNIQGALPRAIKYLSFFELLPYKDFYPYQLSAGIKQRVALAQSLAVEPDILLLDEPFSNIDLHMRNNLLKKLRSEWKRSGMTVVCVTHNLEDTELLGTRIICLGKEKKITLDIQISQEKRLQDQLYKVRKHLMEAAL